MLVRHCTPPAHAWLSLEERTSDSLLDLVLSFDRSNLKKPERQVMGQSLGESGNQTSASGCGFLLESLLPLRQEGKKKRKEL